MTISLRRSTNGNIEILNVFFFVFTIYNLDNTHDEKKCFGCEYLPLIPFDECFLLFYYVGSGYIHSDRSGPSLHSTVPPNMP